MFKFDEEREEYVAEINGVEFACDEPEDGYEEEAQKLSKLYIKKQPEIIEFMFPELQKVYGDIDKSKLPQLLGKPTINLTTCQIMYMEQALDDFHIIEFEYGDDFSEFYYFNIDG